MIYLWSVDFGVVSIQSSQHPLLTAPSALPMSSQDRGLSACGSLGGCGLPSVLSLHSPAAMHYQGRAEDGSRNLVSLPVFCLLGKHGTELLQMGL